MAVVEASGRQGVAAIRVWLYQKRVEKGMTHEDVATKAGIQRAYYTMIEGGTRTPGVKVAKRIADILGFDWTIFFTSP